MKKHLFLNGPSAASVLLVLAGGQFTSISHAATVTASAPAGSTSDWDQNWNDATVASAGSGNFLPAASVPDTAIINQSRTIEVTSVIDVDAGDVIVNNTNDSEFNATLRINGGTLNSGRITLGAGNDEGYLIVSSGTLNSGGITVSAGNPLNSALVNGGAITATGGSTAGASALNLGGGSFTISSGTVTVNEFSAGGGTTHVTTGAGTLNLEGGSLIFAGATGAPDTVQFGNSEINISGGTFSAASCQVIMPANTRVNVIGDAASIRMDSLNLVGSRTATLNFEFDEDGVSTIENSSFMGLSAATLLIDGSNYTEGVGSFPLLLSANLTSVVPPANITVTGFGAEGVGWELVQELSSGGGNGDVIFNVLVDPNANPLIWDGETDANWSIATNWVSDTAPVGDGNDVLTFAGTTNAATINDTTAGTAFKGLHFSNEFDGESFSLAGNNLQLAGSISTNPVADIEFDSITDSIALDMEVVGSARNIELAEQHDLQISGVVSGVGFVKEGAGRLVLSGANTYSGSSTVNAGVLEIENSSALGTTSGGTTIATNAKLELDGGAGDLTIAEGLTIGGGNGGLRSLAGANTITGPITLTANADVRKNGASTLTVAGGVTGTNTNLSLNLTTTFTDNPVNVGNGQLAFTSNGNNPLTASRINVSGNTWGVTRINFSGYVLLGTNDALPTTSDVEFGWSTLGNSTGTLDLNGFDQTVGSIGISANSVGLGGDQTITGTSGTLTVNQAFISTSYEGNFEGGISLVKTGVQTLTLNNLSGIPNSNTGNVTVSEGILSLGDGTNNTDLTDTAHVIVASGGILDLNYSGTDEIAELTLNGTPAAVGEWGADGSGAPNTSTLITGAGTLTVTGAVSNSYDTWASGFAGLTDSTSSLDFDGGGLETGIEYVVGGDPSDSSDDAALAPTSSVSGSDLLFEFRRSDLANNDSNTTIVVEYGNSLAGWTTAVDGVGGVTITETDDDFGAGIDKVVVSLPAGLAVDGKLFARLNVTILP